MANLNKFFDWYEQHVRNRIKFEEESLSAYKTLCEKTSGWASAMKCNVLHNALLAMEGDEQYLEIGSYTGRSLAGALLYNKKLAQVIDPFELFLPDGLVIYEHWCETILKHGLADRVTLHKALCNNMDASLLPPIGVYYYDGDHDSGHTYEGLKKFEKTVSSHAILLVDDYDIFGGHAQRPFPGHNYILDYPVKYDVDRWLRETPHAQLIDVMPWENSTAVIRYEIN